MDTNSIASLARALCNKGEPWQDFHDRLLGDDGLIARLDHDDRRAFRRSADYRFVLRCFRKLYDAQTAVEPATVITVRMPAALHHELKQRAAARGVSLNVFCVLELLGDGFTAWQASSGTQGDGTQDELEQEGIPNAAHAATDHRL